MRKPISWIISIALLLLTLSLLPSKEVSAHPRAQSSITTPNQLHWVLDVALNEDRSRVRKDQAPENLAVLRHIALNLLKQEKTAKGGIHAKQLQAAWHDEYLLKILAQRVFLNSEFYARKEH